MRIKSLRALAVVASAALLVGAFGAVPADAKKKKKPASCKPYVPGEKGAKGGEPVLVTDAATSDSPVTVKVATAPGLGFSSEEGEGNPDEEATSHSYANFQVDSASPSRGVYVKLSWSPPVWDYDLWLRDGSHAPLEYSAGFGPVGSGTDHQHSNVGSESIEGMAVSDCQGITVDIANAAGPGGEVTLTYWLGDVI